METKHVIGLVILLVATAVFRDELAKQLRRNGLL